MNHERWSEDKYRRIYGIRVNHDNADNEVIVELRDIKRLIGCMNHERWSEDKYRRIYGIRVNHDNADNEVIVELRDIKSQINSYMRQMKPYITIND